MTADIATPDENKEIAADGSTAAADTASEIVTPTYRGPERRSARRREPQGFFSLRMLSGHRERRSPGRRAADWETPYVDWYESKLGAAVIGIALLMVADAFLTLQLWQYGAIHVSPLMAGLIESDVRGYVAGKIVLVSLALVLLVVYKNFRFYRIFRVAHLLYALFAGYLLFVTNQLYLWYLL